MTEGGCEAASFPSARFLSPHSFREEVNRETAKVRLYIRGGEEEGGMQDPEQSSIHRCARRERGPSGNRDAGVSFTPEVPAPQGQTFSSPPSRQR